MDAITYTYARQNMASVMDRVCADSEAIIITSPKKKVVMMSYDDFRALEETGYLLSNPYNAKHLRKTITDLNDDKGVETVLADV